MTTDNNEEILVAETQPTVGQQLKIAREAKKITIAEVAAQLRLSSSIVKSLESESWENLHGRAYARGYFLSYVKFLGLPEHDLLAGFNKAFTTTETTSSAQLMLEQKKPLPWLSFVIIIAVILAIWFAFQQWQKTNNDNESVESVSQFQQFINKNSKELFNASVVEPLSEDEQNDALATNPLSDSRD